MQINIKATNLELTPAIKAYIEQKLGVLSKFIKRFEEDGQPEIWVEIARTSKHHQHGQVFMAEADLRLPGKILRASHHDEDARTAVDRLRDQLKLEIEKYKTKTIAKPREIKTRAKSKVS